MNLFENPEDEDLDNVDLQDDNNLEQQPPQDTAPAVPVIDHDAIAATVTAVMAEQMRANAPQRQFTPEETAAHFQVWNPDENFVKDFKAINDPDATPVQQLSAFHKMRDGIMQQAFRASQLLVEQQLGAFRQEMAPAVSYAQQVQATQVMEKFEKKYPALKGQNELVDSITSRLSSQGFKPKSQDEAFDKVAEVAEKILKGVNPEFTLKKSAGARPAMAETNMGGFGGNSTMPQQRQANAGKRGSLAKFFQTTSR